MRRTLVTGFGMALALLLVMACGKSQPGAPQQLKTPAQALDYYKGFEIKYTFGSDTTGGRAQYALSKTLNVNGHDGVQAKVDLFLYGDNNRYAFEYWELKNGVLQGMIQSGTWYVDDNNELVLYKGDTKDVFARGKAEKLSWDSSKGGIYLQLDKSVNLQDFNKNLVASRVTNGWELYYSAREYANRTLPGNKIQGLRDEVNNINSSRSQHGFLD